MDKAYDIAVVGGGASGLAAAVSAARSGARVLLLEGQSRVGRKLLSTGNGRCNVTNSAVCAESYRTDCTDRVRSVFSAVPPEQVKDFLESVGIQCFEEREGRVYPQSEQASAVLDMLRLAAEQLKVEICCDARVSAVHKSGAGFVCETAEKSYRAGRVIIACGSPAAPQLGGCMDGKALLCAMGHTATALSPALTQVLVDSPHTRALKGVRLHCSVALEYNGKPLRTESGELQINDGALSGIAVFQLSSIIARKGIKGCSLCADLMPSLTEGQLNDILRHRRDRLGYLSCEQFLEGMINKRAACCIMKDSGALPLSMPASSLSDKQISKLSGIIKHWRFNATGLAGWKQAQVCSGGVRLSEFGATLQSSLVPGLFACGEVLDCDGDCGGFNLHWAWCSGILAGRSAALTIER